MLDFNLAQNAVGGQVNAVEKVTPISLGHQIRPMGVVKGFCKKETGSRREQLAHLTGSFMQTRCQQKAPTD
jgi:hypothetical protein